MSSSSTTTRLPSVSKFNRIVSEWNSHPASVPVGGDSGDGDGDDDDDAYLRYVRFVSRRMAYLQQQHDTDIPACLCVLGASIERWESRETNPFYRDEAAERLLTLEARREALFEEFDRIDRELRQAAVSLSFVADATTHGAQTRVASDDLDVRAARMRWDARIAREETQGLGG
jgi:hypothetical protein